MTYLQLLTKDVMDQHDIQKLCETIWPAPYAAEATKATIDEAINRQLGQIFAIRSEHHQIVGITGYFDIHGHTAYLRWTGIRPLFQRNGFFREAIKLLTTQLKGANPQVDTLVELVPDNEYGNAISKAFESMGFIAQPDLDVIPEGEDADWKVIPYVLHF